MWDAWEGEMLEGESMCANLKSYSMAKPLVAFLAFWAAASGAFAEAVRNGNETALAYVEAADAKSRQAVLARTTNTLHTFRYLRVVRITKDQPEAGLYRIETIEPSSDMIVVLDVAKRKLSLELAATLVPGDCLNVQGRIRGIAAGAKDEPPRMFVESANLRFKDRSAPKAGAETLDEVDPRAVKTAE